MPDRTTPLPIAVGNARPLRQLRRWPSTSRHGHRPSSPPHRSARPGPLLPLSLVRRRVVPHLVHQHEPAARCGHMSHQYNATAAAAVWRGNRGIQYSRAVSRQCDAGAAPSRPTYVLWPCMSERRRPGHGAGAAYALRLLAVSEAPSSRSGPGLRPTCCCSPSRQPSARLPGPVQLMSCVSRGTSTRPSSSRGWTGHLHPGDRRPPSVESFQELPIPRLTRWASFLFSSPCASACRLSGP